MEEAPIINTPKPIDKPEPKGKTDTWINNYLQSDPFLANIINNPKEYNTQIIYTKIDRDNQNNPKFTDYEVNLDPNFYFYPASTVKMPIAFLALQKLNELNNGNFNLTKDMTMITEKATNAQTTVYNDPTTVDGRPTIANYIKKIFLVSDNDAFNRLYEFLGQEYINTTLQRMGYKSTEILHRLSVSLPAEENKITNPIKFLDANGNEIYTQPNIINTIKYATRKDFRGTGYMSGNTKVDKPFDFSAKNRLSLVDLHEMLKAILFPKSVENKKRFNITEDDRKFLLTYMSKLPKESVFPSYNANDYWDTYVKFNMYGSEKKNIPNNIRIFNKVGDAYGYFTDVSYIVDFEKNIEFMVSATIYANKDGIFNDDKYEMDEVAMPFFKKLGEALYNYELKRDRHNAPDLNEFKLTYN